MDRPAVLATVGSSRVRELAAARELLRPDRATTDHDRVLDVVAERVLMDMFTPGWRPSRSREARADIVIAARTPGRVAAPSAC